MSFGWCAQTALQESETRFRFQSQLLDNVREAVVGIDLEGRIIYWGKGAEALYEHTAGEVLGEPVEVIVGSWPAAGIAHDFNNILAAISLYAQLCKR